MSNKPSTFFATYQIRSTPPTERESSRGRLCYEHQGFWYFFVAPLLGMTETQKVVLERVSITQRKVPVVSISHEKTTTPDRPSFRERINPYTTYYPYAMTVATVAFLDGTSQVFRVYFCDGETHEHNFWTQMHVKFYKRPFIVPLEEALEV